MKIIDSYILKRYLITFVFTLLILIPIAVAIDIAEKVDKFLAADTLTTFEIINDYYKNFIIYYANTFMPLALFVAVIIFTSKLSNNTEIVAINNAKVSFTRFLYPYFIGATMITILSLVMNHFVVPSSSKVRKKFEKTYLQTKKYGEYQVRDFSLQLTDSSYIYIQSFDLKRNTGFTFSEEVYDGYKLKRKFTADNISWDSKKERFKLSRYRIRKIYEDRDSIFSGNSIDTTFAFTPNDLIYKAALAQEMPSDELIKYINLSKKRGVKNLNAHIVELHKRTSLPISSYILTVIAVALAFKRRRGGTGVNLAVGFGLMFVYIFFLKVSEVLGAVAGANSLLSVWVPNFVFGALAIYLYYNARK
ncbi:MAG: LptF/LptG family permease [Flavobacteriaceae bacterium]|nr:LptF/LptG family permease [Flavobacteriaceae bacterium]